MRYVEMLALMFTAMLLFGCAYQQNSGSQTEGAGDGAIEGEGKLKVQVGDVVAVDYVGSLDDGMIFDTSIREEAVKAGLPLQESYEPLEFIAGAGQMIPGFDSAVIGMEEGEEKSVRVQPIEAYGEVQEEAVIVVPRGNIEGEVGVGMSIQTPEGLQGIIVAVDDEMVTIDFNHPLAGKHLNFRIIVREIRRE